MIVVVVFSVGPDVQIFGPFPDRATAQQFVNQRGFTSRVVVQEVNPAVIQVKTDFVRPIRPIRANPLADLDQLYQEIQSAGGVLEPLDCVRLVNGFYQARTGFRRLMCAIALGLPTVPVRVIG